MVEGVSRERVARIIGGWNMDAPVESWADSAVGSWSVLSADTPVEWTADMVAALAWTMAHDDVMDMMLVGLLHPTMGATMLKDLACGRDQYGLNRRLGREVWGDTTARPDMDMLVRVRDRLVDVSGSLPKPWDWRPLGLAAFAAYLAGDPRMSMDAHVADRAAPDAPDGLGGVNALARMTLMCLSERISPSWRRTPGVLSTPVEPMPAVRPSNGVLRLTVPSI